MAMQRLDRRQTGYVLTGSMAFSITLAVAFFIFAMPAQIFEALVVASGLPKLVGSAQPPLGDTARTLAGGVCGLAAGIATCVMFWLIDRRDERLRNDRKESFVSDPSFEAFVPAAPAAAPEPVAVLELTEAMPVAPELPEAAPDPVKPLRIDELNLQPVPPAEGPIFVDFTALRAVSSKQEPQAEEEPLDLAPWQMQESAPFGAAAPKVKWMPTRAADLPDDGESISALMTRLEAGLERRSEQHIAGAQPIRKPAARRALRSALDELREMAVHR